MIPSGELDGELEIDTRLITLIGSPLRQSFAARMQNRAYAAAGLRIHYFYTEAGEEHLREILGGIRYMPAFLGCAVTKPNKVAVLACLDELDELCAKMGACNTVCRLPDGRLKGYNTDGIGFYRSIASHLTVSGGDFFCMGAGGAGRAICCALAHYGARRLYVTDGVPERALTLQEELRSRFGAHAQAVPLGDFRRAPDCGVVINATGVGMGASVGQSPIPAELLQPGQFCFDACYNPEKTQFLLDAEHAGCRTQNGLEMSLHQGAAQFELWTGRPAPMEVMREELREITKERRREQDEGIKMAGQQH